MPRSGAPASYLRASLLLSLCLGACEPSRDARTDSSAASAAVAVRRTDSMAARATPAAPAQHDVVIETLTVAPRLPSVPAPDWKVYRGDGFELRYPPEATIAPRTSHPMGLEGTGIFGPRIALRTRNGNVGTQRGPAYLLVLSLFPNPNNESLDAWVEDVRRMRNTPPLDPDSLDFVDPPTVGAIGGARTLSLQPYCGDCEPEEIYLAGPGRILVASKLGDISIPGDRDAQGRLYDAILGTLRWTK